MNGQSLCPHSPNKLCLIAILNKSIRQIIVNKKKTLNVVTLTRGIKNNSVTLAPYQLQFWGPSTKFRFKYRARVMCVI